MHFYSANSTRQILKLVEKYFLIAFSRTVTAKPLTKKPGISPESM